MDIRQLFWCYRDIVVKLCVKKFHLVEFIPFAWVLNEFLSCECWVKKVRIFDKKVTKIRVREIRVSEIRVREIRVSKISVREIRVSKMRVSKMRVSKIRVSKIRVSKMRVSKMRVREIRVREIRVREIRISSNHRELHGAIFVQCETDSVKRSKMIFSKTFEMSTRKRSWFTVSPSVHERFCAFERPDQPSFQSHMQTQKETPEQRANDIHENKKKLHMRLKTIARQCQQGHHWVTSLFQIESTNQQNCSSFTMKPPQKVSNQIWKVVRIKQIALALEDITLDSIYQSSIEKPRCRHEHTECLKPCNTEQHNRFNLPRMIDSSVKPLDVHHICNVFAGRTVTKWNLKAISRWKSSFWFTWAAPKRLPITQSHIWQPVG